MSRNPKPFSRAQKLTVAGVLAMLVVAGIASFLVLWPNTKPATPKQQPPRPTTATPQQKANPNSTLPGISQGDFRGGEYGPSATYIGDWSWLGAPASGGGSVSPAFQSLKADRLRVFVPWDIIDAPASRLSLFERMLDHAKNNVGDLAVTLVDSCKIEASEGCDEQPAPVNTESYIDAVKRLLAAYPGRINFIAAWNEPNLSKAYQESPKAAAELTYRLRVDACTPQRQCQVVAGDFAGEQEPVKASEARPWQRYARTYKSELTRLFAGNGTPELMPTIWGFHPYHDVWQQRQTLEDRDTFRFMADEYTPPGVQIWLSELGSRVDWRKRRGTLGQLDKSDQVNRSVGNQNSEVSYLVNDLVRTTRGIKKVDRLYYYHLCAVNQNDVGNVWDSGLAGALAGTKGRRSTDDHELKETKPCKQKLEQEQRPAFETFKAWSSVAGR